MTERPSTPHLYIFNISKAGARHTSDSPDAPHLFLPSFANALASAMEHKAIVQCAVYSAAPTEGGSIFIDTEDEEWSDRIGIGRREVIENKLNETVLNQADFSQEQTRQKNTVSIFIIGKPLQGPSQQLFVLPGQTDSDDEQQLLKAFIEAIYNFVKLGVKIESAVYGAEEGAKIFVHA